MVSTQTSLTCPRSDNLLPQSLLYNIITAKLAEAFEMTNMHAKLCDYNDNLRSIKRETNQRGYNFTSNFPERPHFDLIIPPSDVNLQNQRCFSPDAYRPRKRQRLNSALSPAGAVRAAVGISTRPDPGVPLRCPNCTKAYRSRSTFTAHIKRCKDMVFKSPLMATCRELTYEPDKDVFEHDIATELNDTLMQLAAEQDVLCNTATGSSPRETSYVSTSSTSRDTSYVSRAEATDVSSPGSVRFTPDKLETDSENVMVAFLVNNDSLKSPDQDSGISEVQKNEVNDRRTTSNKTADNSNFPVPARRGRPPKKYIVSAKTKPTRQQINKILLDKIKTAKQVAKNKNEKNKKTKKEMKPLPKIQKSAKTELKNTKAGKSETLQSASKSAKTTKLRARKADSGAATNNNTDSVVVTKSETEVTAMEATSHGTRVNLHPVMDVIAGAAVSTSNLKEKQHGCNSCSCKFASRWSVRRHEYVVHGIGTPVTSDDVALRQGGTECRVCAEQTPKAAADVADKPPAQDMWICGICGKNLHKKSHLIEHREVHDTLKPAIPQDNGKFLCYVCHANFESCKALTQHIHKQHNPLLTCSLCYKIFTSQSMLSAHNCGSDVQIKCKHCAKSFSRQSEHMKHMNTTHASLQHSLDKTNCKLCDYTFSSVLKYKVHQTVCHPTHDMMCSVCSELLGSKDALTAHIILLHDPAPFLCTVCEAGFSTLEQLTTHKAQHFK